MRAEELTIGCNVVFDTWICRVDQINPPYINVSHRGHERCVHIDDLKPVVVTAGLLYDMGFRRKNTPSEDWLEYENEAGNHWLTFKFDMSNTIGRNWYLHIDNCDRQTAGSCDVQYLHEVQALCNIFGIEFRI